MEKEKLKLYDSGIFMGYMTRECVKKELKSGFIKKVKGFRNIYQTDVSFLDKKKLAKTPPLLKRKPNKLT